MTPPRYQIKISGEPRMSHGSMITDDTATEQELFAYAGRPSNEADRAYRSTYESVAASLQPGYRTADIRIDPEPSSEARLSIVLATDGFLISSHFHAPHLRGTPRPAGILGWYTTAEAAQALGMTHSAIHKAIERGTLDAIPIHPRLSVILPTEVEHYRLHHRRGHQARTPATKGD